MKVALAKREVCVSRSASALPDLLRSAPLAERVPLLGKSTHRSLIGAIRHQAGGMIGPSRT